MKNFHYHKPRRMEDVWKLMGEIDGEVLFLGGGTDLFPQMKQDLRYADHVIDLKKISELDFLRIEENQSIRIGANVTLSKLLGKNVLPKCLSLLTDAVYRIGSPQIRNKATLVGNICNASPAADSAPPLICLRAKVKVEDGRSHKHVDLEDFFKGPGQTILKREEMVTEVLIPYPSDSSKGAFIKLGRVAKDLATVNVGVLIELDPDGETCLDAKIVLGAVGPTAIRIMKCEDLLIGKKISDISSLEVVGEIAMESSKPISDVRATAEYRKKMVGVLTKRAINETLKSLKNEET